MNQSPRILVVRRDNIGDSRFAGGERHRPIGCVPREPRLPHPLGNAPPHR